MVDPGFEPKLILVSRGDWSSMTRWVSPMLASTTRNSGRPGHMRESGCESTRINQQVECSAGLREGLRAIREGYIFSLELILDYCMCGSCICSERATTIPWSLGSRDWLPRGPLGLVGRHAIAGNEHREGKLPSTNKRIKGVLSVITACPTFPSQSHLSKAR